MLLLQKSLKVLSTATGATYIRFWGMIRGTEKDYYIAEGAYEGGEDEGDIAPDVEPRGSGVNKLSYWASNSAIGPWIVLPYLKPQDI